MYGYLFEILSKKLSLERFFCLIFSRKLKEDWILPGTSLFHMKIFFIVMPNLLVVTANYTLTELSCMLGY